MKIKLRRKHEKISLLIIQVFHCYGLNYTATSKSKLLCYTLNCSTINFFYFELSQEKVRNLSFKCKNIIHL